MAGIFWPNKMDMEKVVDKAVQDNPGDTGTIPKVFYKYPPEHLRDMADYERSQRTGESIEEIHKARAAEKNVIDNLGLQEQGSAIPAYTNLGLETIPKGVGSTPSSRPPQGLAEPRRVRDKRLEDKREARDNVRRDAKGVDQK
ncbi:hypothetical protein HK104_010722 [Borealophlyctis nickersoniae]|nr:hypothetical protein HK104_010722 [Borealophlyctis nickersoniae]